MKFTTLFLLGLQVSKNPQLHSFLLQASPSVPYFVFAVLFIVYHLLMVWAAILMFHSILWQFLELDDFDRFRDTAPLIFTCLNQNVPLRITYYKKSRIYVYTGNIKIATKLMSGTSNSWREKTTLEFVSTPWSFYNLHSKEYYGIFRKAVELQRPSFLTSIIIG